MYCLIESSNKSVWLWDSKREGVTKVNNLDSLEKAIFEAEVLLGPFRAVVLDVRKATGPKDMIVTASYGPIEVRHSFLIIQHVGVSHEVRGPGRLLWLRQITRQDLLKGTRQLLALVTRIGAIQFSLTSEAFGFRWSARVFNHRPLSSPFLNVILLGWNFTEIIPLSSLRKKKQSKWNVNKVKITWQKLVAETEWL